jgi:plastocyanin
MKSALPYIAALSLVACTPGSSAAPGAGGGPAGGQSVTIDVDLTNDPGGPTPDGLGGGYKPLMTRVPVGSFVRFTNSDGFAHTATSIPGSTFPSAYPFTSTALQQSGATLSGGFSSGSLVAGATSQTLLADLAGTYAFGCFYHYGTPMRAVIIVQ